MWAGEPFPPASPPVFFKATGDRCIVSINQRSCQWLREDQRGQAGGGRRVSSTDWTAGKDSRALPKVPPAR